MTMNEEKRGRGRPPKYPADEREQKRRDYHKDTGYASQKKYQDKGEFHEIKVLIRKEFMPIIGELLTSTKKNSPAKLFIDAVEKQYGVSLERDVDKKDD